MRPALLLSLCLASAALLAPAPAWGGKVMDDLNSTWFHVGGGFGFQSDENGEVPGVGGRFILGGGAYTIGVFAGGGLQAGGNSALPFHLHGVGMVGFAIPIPVVHFMIGMKGGAGMGVLQENAPLPTPSVTVGGLLGFIIREFAGDPGFRLMFEPGWRHSPLDGVHHAELYVTFALVL